MATERYDRGEPVNIGSGEEITVADLADMIARLTGFRGRVRWNTDMPDGQPRRLLDGSRARLSFGFEAEVRLEEGLKRTIAWWEGERR
jgi:GDP-L-fucose synthase